MEWGAERRASDARATEVQAKESVPEERASEHLCSTAPPPTTLTMEMLQPLAPELAKVIGAGVASAGLSRVEGLLAPVDVTALAVKMVPDIICGFAPVFDAVNRQFIQIAEVVAHQGGGILRRSVVGPGVRRPARLSALTRS